MDLNADGHVDILSGSYSRRAASMAGLFQVLWGAEDHAFRAAEALNGTDDEPLIIPADDDDIEHITDKICTRPTAVDLNGDGKLDIVSGNFSGTFYLFDGEGEGRFAPQPSLLMAGGTPLKVPTKSDPFFVDWDRDGDLDMLSGSGKGGVFLVLNTGTRKAPVFAEPVEILKPAETLEPADIASAEIMPDGMHPKGPGSSTRVWAGDLDGDGKLDLLVGDNALWLTPVAGVDFKTAMEQYAAWRERRQEVVMMRSGGSPEKHLEKQEKLFELQKELGTFVNEHYGCVWVLYQK